MEPKKTQQQQPNSPPCPALKVEGLSTSFFTAQGEIKAVEQLSFEVLPGQTLGIVGESGCGKTVAGLSLMRLIASPYGKIVGGRVRLQGRDLLSLQAHEMRHIWGNEMSMIFQEPMNSLNPMFSIGSQIAEVLEVHRSYRPAEVYERVVEGLQAVGIVAPEKRYHDYPHQLSGGMRQRVLIAMALICGPKVLIADEPTTALDVTIQAQILELLKKLQSQLGMALILITHDLGVIAEVADQVAVMYAGQMVELGSASSVILQQEAERRNSMPYTQGLLGSYPSFDPQGSAGPKQQRLKTIPGLVQSPLDRPPGCRFHPRCGEGIPQCQIAVPDLRELSPRHWVRCIRRN